jgi:hypothetical protein
MIAHINKYFNLSCTVNSLGYIFELIDIKQVVDKLVITLKAWFSRLFALLKMGMFPLTWPQVGFVLQELFSQYQGVVEDFHLGRHSHASAFLQSVVNQCTAYVCVCVWASGYEGGYCKARYTNR